VGRPSFVFFHMQFRESWKGLGRERRKIDSLKAALAELSPNRSHNGVALSGNVRTRQPLLFSRGPSNDAVQAYCTKNEHISCAFTYRPAPILRLSCRRSSSLSSACLGDSDDKWTEWLGPTANVLGERVCLVGLETSTVISLSHINSAGDLTGESNFYRGWRLTFSAYPS
jgi:hypothetical protein